MTRKAFSILTVANVEIKMLRPKQKTRNGKNSEFRQFSVLVPNVYDLNEVDEFTDETVQIGTEEEHQEIEWFCTAFQADHVALLDTLKVGDFISVEGIPQPVWKGYIADGSKEGERFTIPDIGRPTGKSDKGRDIPPKAQPYRMDKQTPGFYVHAAVPNITVMKLQRDLDTEAQETVPADPNISIANIGSVYILKNEAMPALVKIGFTETQTAKDRAYQLYYGYENQVGTGVPLPFDIVHEEFCNNPKELEELIHRELDGLRLNKDREFFKFPDPSEAIQKLQEVHLQQPSHAKCLSSDSLLRKRKSQSINKVRPSLM